jgi:hypothetical protein
VHICQILLYITSYACYSNAPCSFRSDRHKVANTSDISSRTNIDPSIFLVFTGGQFIYPGVEVGFTRNINVEAYGKVVKCVCSHVSFHAI